MKKVALAVIFLLATCSISHAAWDDTFLDLYKDKGIDDAVDQAYNKDKVETLDILEKGMILHLGLEENSKKLGTPELIKALYCAGVPGKDTKAALKDWNKMAATDWSEFPKEEWEITEKDVYLGFKKANTECAEIVARSRAYPPGTTSKGTASPSSP